MPVSLGSVPAVFPAIDEVLGGMLAVLAAMDVVLGGMLAVLAAMDAVLGGMLAVLAAMDAVLGGMLAVLAAMDAVLGGKFAVLTAKELVRGGFRAYDGGKRPAMSSQDLLLGIQEAQRALLLSQQDLASITGASLRTVQRWYAGQASPSPNEIARLAAAVYPTDPDLARRLAMGVGRSLESLGVAVAPRLSPLLVDSVVSAAAEALDISPRVARPAVLAAAERAKAAGLSIDDLLAVLRPVAAGKPAKP
jgi:transcriptional regulator with XRE-family HTH domain